ncbi:MAG: glycosyltransferase family 2 protein [Candidatus Omnitrophica bacterium]|nr:glycosyltransferase family 2 protein [Candidatus Omnitrophota bacterium]
MLGAEVSVLIPVKNGGELFRRALSMVLSQQTSFVYEVIVIDSGSSDGSDRFAESLRDPRLTLHRIPPEEFNHGSTRNFAAGLAQGALLVFMVQDALPGNVRWLESLIAPMADPTLAGVCARQLPRPESGYFVRKYACQILAYSTKSRVASVHSAEAFERLSAAEKYSLCYFDNVCACIRRSVWQNIQFDRVDFGEDIRWARKALLAGYRLAFEPSAFVYHSHDRPWTYTFKRLTHDHWNLYHLFGMECVPSFRFAVRAFWGSWIQHCREAREADLAFYRKLPLFMHACSKPFAEVFGQYWGLRLAKAGRGPAFRGV